MQLFLLLLHRTLVQSPSQLRGILSMHFHGLEIKLSKENFFQCASFGPTCFPPDPVMGIKCNSCLITGIYTSTSKPPASTCAPAAVGWRQEGHGSSCVCLISSLPGLRARSWKSGRKLLIEAELKQHTEQLQIHIHCLKEKSENNRERVWGERPKEALVATV